jgi:hypothetical protein
MAFIPTAGRQGRAPSYRGTAPRGCTRAAFPGRQRYSCQSGPDGLFARLTEDDPPRRSTSPRPGASPASVYAVGFDDLLHQASILRHRSVNACPNRPCSLLPHADLPTEFDR